MIYIFQNFSSHHFSYLSLVHFQFIIFAFGFLENFSNLRDLSALWSSVETAIFPWWCRGYDPWRTSGWKSKECFLDFVWSFSAQLDAFLLFSGTDLVKNQQQAGLRFSRTWHWSGHCGAYDKGPSKNDVSIRYQEPGLPPPKMVPYFRL